MTFTRQRWSSTTFSLYCYLPRPCAVVWTSNTIFHTALLSSFISQQYHYFFLLLTINIKTISGRPINTRSTGSGSETLTKAQLRECVVRRYLEICLLFCSVADPWHLGTDPDLPTDPPDPDQKHWQSPSERMGREKRSGNLLAFLQCCGCVIFRYGSGSAPLTCGSRFGSGSCYQWLSGWQPKLFFSYHFLKLHLHHCSKIKSHKEEKEVNTRNQGFSYY